MTAEAVGEHRLRRQQGGRGYFGHAKVRLVRREAGSPAVVWAVPADDRASVQPGTDAEFVDAAIAGAEDGLRLLADPDRAVRLEQVLMNLADIDATATRAAATLAVLNAAGADDRYVSTFDGGWQVVPA
ncbi:hypothetical protein [Amycolatopsis sp. NPDC059021]|uniref:hypothetical protein n=1 Tax=Amycolatopsis sp. NPDC059021 TaxID=3346704 RepID=UPI00366FB806